MKKLIIFWLICLTVTVCMVLTVNAEDKMSIEIPYVETPPVLDGIAMGGEYLGESVVMNDHTAEAWVGEMSREAFTIWNFVWDEAGLYIFATVRDRTPVYRDESTHWVGADCLEIGLNPGHILGKNDDKGVFFSMGATADGRVMVHRHNYDEGMVTAEVRGCAVGHTEGSNSYTIEVCIPWSLIFIEADCTKTDTHLDATKLVPEEDLVMDMVLAAIDAENDSTIGIAYKFIGTDFVTGQYIPAALTGTTPTETVGSTSVDTEPGTYPEAETAPGLIIVPATDSEEMTLSEPDSETETASADATLTDAGASVKRQGCGGVMETTVLILFLCVGTLSFLACKHAQRRET